MVAIGSALEEGEASGGPIAFGTIGVFISMVMIVIGSILKALAPKSREER